MSVGLADGAGGAGGALGALGALGKRRTRTPSAAGLPKQVRLIGPDLSTASLAETQRRRTLILAVLTVALTALFALLVAWFHVLSAIVLLTWIVCAAIAWRPLV